MKGASSPGCGVLAALAAALVLLLPAHRARAAEIDPDRAVAFGIGGGASLPTGDARDVLRSGFHGHGFVRVQLGALPVSVRLEGSYENFDLHPAAFPDGGTATLTAGILGTQLDLQGGAARPYVLAGAGVCNLRTETGDAVTTTESRTQLLIQGGAGIWWTLGPFGLYAECRLDHAFVGDGPLALDAVQVVPLSLGFTF